jgi:hypothetical protein
LKCYGFCKPEQEKERPKEKKPRTFKSLLETKERKCIHDATPEIITGVTTKAAIYSVERLHEHKSGCNIKTFP